MKVRDKCASYGNDLIQVLYLPRLQQETPVQSDTFVDVVDKTIALKLDGVIDATEDNIKTVIIVYFPEDTIPFVMSKVSTKGSSKFSRSEGRTAWQPIS